jgi:hypothetical protein
MSAPYTLCAVAIVAAFAAAGIGWRYKPAARARRQRAKYEQMICHEWALKFERVRLTVEGQFAIHGSEDVWLHLLANHPELYAGTGQQGGI